MVGRITISVSDAVKEILEREKGDMTWDEFLLILINEFKRKEREERLRELMKILAEDDIKEIEKSHEEMHEFRLRLS